jgi:hypothetical protein
MLVEGIGIGEKVSGVRYQVLGSVLKPTETLDFWYERMRFWLALGVFIVLWDSRLGCPLRTGQRPIPQDF